MPRLVAVSGSTRRPSRTRTLVEAVAARVARARPVTVEVYDLIDAGPGLGAAHTREALTPEAARVVEAIESADALIVGTPVYKGSYAGLFKHLFDLVEPSALENVPVVLTANGGGPLHGLVVEHGLRPLFGFFAALTVPTAIYACDRDFLDGRLVGATVLTRVEAAADQLTALLTARSLGTAQGETSASDRSPCAPVPAAGAAAWRPEAQGEQDAA